MDIVFDSPKFRKDCNEYKRLVRRYGTRGAQVISRRLGQLRTVDTLEDMRQLPGRCHELTGDLAGLLSLDLDHPRRLFFAPANNPVPSKPDGGMDWTGITAVTIRGVEDPHG